MPQTRDKLAKDRTVLANQRTFLAYVRTAIMLLATGLTFIKLFPHDSFLLILGWTLVPVGLSVLVLGQVLYLRMHYRIEASTEEQDSKALTSPVLSAPPRSSKS
ncbi:MAG TPA: DUF202 domain-containing protein [Saprospiraceae bacterium]|nr:DUF202 domain-containing protein [Saprospiraceae bacterium]